MSPPWLYTSVPTGDMAHFKHATKLRVILEKKGQLISYAHMQAHLYMQSDTHTCIMLAGSLVRGATIRYRKTDSAARLKISAPTVTEVMKPRRTQVPPPSCQSWKLALRRTQGRVNRAPRSARLRLRSRRELGLERLRGFLTSTSHSRRWPPTPTTRETRLTMGRTTVKAMVVLVETMLKRRFTMAGMVQALLWVMNKIAGMRPDLKIEKEMVSKCFKKNKLEQREGK